MMTDNYRYLRRVGLILAAALLSCAPEVPQVDVHGVDLDDDEPTTIGEASEELRLNELIPGCTTAGTEGISAQLLEEMACLSDGAMVSASHPNVTLQSSRVHLFLSPDARTRLYRAADRVPIRINSALRTIAEQYKLLGGCATVAAPGTSNHETGRAIDVSNWRSVASVLVSEGFRHPLPHDPVHFDGPGPDLRHFSVLAFQRLWNANHPEDRLAEDGVSGPATISRLGSAPAGGFPIGRVCGAAPPEPACEPLRDICGTTFEEDIRWMFAEGITAGCGEGRYCPDRAITRGELAVFFDRAFDLADGPNAFDDDDGNPYEGSINALAAAGITAGCGTRAYCPDRIVTRGQLAAMLSNALRLPAGPDAFGDDDGSPFEASIDALAASGLTSGCAAGRFCPNDEVTRGSIARFLRLAVTSCRYGPFTDVCDSPFRDDIVWMAEEGITGGCAADRYCPEQTVTRGHLAVFLDRAFGLPDGPDAFDDDDGHRFEASINAVAAAGITSGCGARAFCPDDEMRRDHMAVFLVRAMGLAPGGANAFDDDDGSAYEEYIDALAAAGVTQGCGPRTYCPDRIVTRGPMAAFIHRAATR